MQRWSNVVEEVEKDEQKTEMAFSLKQKATLSICWLGIIGITSFPSVMFALSTSLPPKIVIQVA